MNKQQLFRLLVAIGLLMGGALPLLSQTATARLTGRITDSSGAVVPGARVTVLNVETGIKSQTRSNGAGYYTVPLLPPGQYKISITKSGFQTYMRSGITLEVNETGRVDATLQIGKVTQAVTVTGAPPLVDTENATVSQEINNKTVLEMPLESRNLWSLVGLSPGVTLNKGAGDVGEIPVTSIAGGPAYAQTISIDGAVINKTDTARNQAELSPMVDSIREFKVLDSDYSAEYGRASGGVITAAIRSGTNQFHGDLFEFVRNDAFDARDFFAKTMPPVRYNQFGGTLGGPIIKNKTFFFFGIEKTYNYTSGPYITTVPTMAERQGDFSKLVDSKGNLIQLYNPFSTTLDPTTGTYVRQPFAGNIIDPSLFDSVGSKLASLYPKPNLPGTATGANNYLTNDLPRKRVLRVTARVDHQINATNRLSFHYINQTNDIPLPQSDINPVISPLGRDTTNSAQNFLGSYTHIFSADMVNELDFSYMRQGRTVTTAGVGGNWPSKLGLTGVSNDAFPDFSVPGYMSMSLFIPYVVNIGNGYDLTDSVSYTKGRHFIKYGGEFRFGNFVSNYGFYPSGEFGFSTLETGQPGVSNTGNAFASLLLGTVQSAQIDKGVMNSMSDNQYALYVQDDWRAMRGLTLDLGLRWEAETAPICNINCFNGFDPTEVNPNPAANGALGALTFAGANGMPRSPWNTSWKNFAPRFGFAWQPFGSSKTVVRGGFGVFFGAPDDNGVAGGSGTGSANLGFNDKNAISSVNNGITPAMYLQDGYPAFEHASPSTRTPGFGVGGAVDFFQRNRPTPYTMQFNFGIQRQWKGILTEIQYLGNQGRHLTSPLLSIDQVPPSLVGTSTNIRSLQPYPQYSNVYVDFPNLGSSSYNALAVRVEKNYHKGLQFIFNYTYSKLMDNVQGISGGDLGGVPGYENYYDRRLDWSVSGNNLTNDASYEVIWDLPAGPGRHWLHSGPLSQVLGGWELSVLGEAHSGIPFGVTTQTNNCDCASAGAQRANLIGNPVLPSGQRTLLEWFNTNAFAQPAQYQFGTAGRQVLYGPNAYNTDMALMKNFTFFERYRLQFRGEFFNAFNHPNFSIPNHTFGSSAFGTITGSSAARVIQLGAKLYF